MCTDKFSQVNLSKSWTELGLVLFFSAIHMAFLWPQVWAEEGGHDKTLVHDLGTLAICTCSLHLPSGCSCFWSQMYETSYNGLLLGPPKLRLPRWSSAKESACQIRRCKRHSFYPWIVKIPWSRKWQPTPVKSCTWLSTAQPSDLVGLILPGS